MIGGELVPSGGLQVLLLLLRACASGFFIGVLYECFRVLRRLLRHPQGLVAVEDILFFSLAALVCFHFLLEQAEGRPRAYLLIGQALGAALYFGTVGRLVTRAVDCVSQKIGKLRKLCQKKAKQAQVLAQFAAKKFLGRTNTP